MKPLKLETTAESDRKYKCSECKRISTMAYVAYNDEGQALKIVCSWSCVKDFELRYFIDEFYTIMDALDIIHSRARMTLDLCHPSIENFLHPIRSYKASRGATKLLAVSKYLLARYAMLAIKIRLIR